MTNTKTATAFDENAGEPAVTTTVEPQAPATGESVVNQLVGEGKKYKTVEDLAKSRVEADVFIEQLKREAKEAKEDAISKAEVDKRFDEFLARVEQTSVANNSKGNTNPALGSEQIAEIVRNQLTKAEAEKTADQNIIAAHKKLVGQYGDKAGDFLENKARELGLTKNDLKVISAKSPTAFFSIVGLDASKAPEQVSLSKGSVNTEAHFNRDTKTDTWDYYNDLRRKDKATYYSSAVQNEIFNKVKSGVLPNKT